MVLVLVLFFLLNFLFMMMMLMQQVRQNKAQMCRKPVHDCCNALTQFVNLADKLLPVARCPLPVACCLN